MTAHERVLRNALPSEIPDYEDAVIDELAAGENIDFISTRDLKYFKKSRNTAYTAVEALEVIEG